MFTVASRVSTAHACNARIKIGFKIEMPNGNETCIKMCIEGASEQKTHSPYR